MKKAVIFDMYETLITHYSCPLYFSREMSEDAGIDEAYFRKMWRSSDEARTLGRLRFEDTIREILSSKGVFSEEKFQRIVTKRIETKEECFRHFHPEIMPMLLALRDMGVKIGLISNCFSEEAAVIRQSEMFPFFDAVCLSYELGLKKPDIAIYENCLYKLGLKPEECIYVGDGGSFELEGAESAGIQAMQAIWYLKEETFQPTGPKEEFFQLKSPMDILGHIK